MEQTPLDVAGGIERLGDAEIWQEIVQDYIDVCEGLITEIGNSIAAGDAQKLRQDSHAVKGSSAELLASRMASLSADLEHMGRENQLDGAERKFSELREEFARLVDFVRDASISG